MRVLITGSSGWIGALAKQYFESCGSDVFVLKRGPLQSSQKKEIYWDPSRGEVSLEALSGFDAVIHLAGKNIAKGLWTQKNRKEIFSSRCKDTYLLASSLAKAKLPPKMVLSASATGFYGDRGEEIVLETSLPGRGFLSDVAVHWEKSLDPLRGGDTKVCIMRFGTVLGSGGGVLQVFSFLSKMGLPLCLGKGDQWLSWIALKDLIRAFAFLIEKREEGIFNLVSPAPCHQKELACRLQKFSLFSMKSTPRWLLLLLLGNMAKELFLSSTRAIPDRLCKAGFSFRYPTLSEALSQDALLKDGI